MTTRTDQLVIKFTTDGDGKVVASLAGVERALGGVDKAGAKAGGPGGGIDLAKKALGAFSAYEVTRFITAAAVETQKLDAMMRTYTGSQAGANQELDRLRKLASDTGQPINELVSAFGKLTLQGIRPTDQLMRSLANTAVATQKSLDQVIEAAGNAADGEFQKLKSLGFQVKEVGNEIELSIAGVSARVQEDGTGVVEVLERIGNTRFADAARAQAEGLSGAVEDLRAELKGLASDAVGAEKGVFGIADVAEVAADSLARLLREARELNTYNPAMLLGGIAARPLARDPEAEAAAVGDNVSMYGELRGVIDGVVDALNRRIVAEARIDEKTKERVTALNDEADAYGLLRSEQLELQKIKDVAAADTEAERQAITQAYDAQIRKVRATEAEAAAERKAADAKRRSREETERSNELHREALAIIKEMEPEYQRYMEALEAKDDAEVRNRETLRQQVEQLHVATDAVEELRLELELLDAAQAANAAPAAVIDRKRAAILQSLDAELIRRELEAFGESAGSYYADALFRNLESIPSALVDLFRRGGEDAGAVLLDIVEQTLADLAEVFLQQQLILPIQADILSGMGLSGGAIRQSLGLAQNAAIPSFFGGGSGAGAGAGLSGGAAMFGAFALPIVGAAAGGYAGGAVGGALGGALFASTATGAALIGSTGLAAGTAAATGAQLGSVVPIIGTIIGAIIGLAIAYFMREDPPNLRVVGGNVIGQRGTRNPARRFDTALGEVGFADVDTIDQKALDKLQQAFIDFDQAIADLLTEEEIERVEGALANVSTAYREGAISLEQMLSDRLQIIVNEIEPAWNGFLSGIEDLKERVQAFAGLREIQKYVEDFDDVLALIEPEIINRLRTEVTNLNEAVDTSLADLREALDRNDPAAAAERMAAAEQAIIRRYQREIELVRELDAAIRTVTAQMRNFRVSIAQRIAATGGDPLGAVNAARANIDVVRGNVLNARDTEQALQHLDEFVATVDTWLSESRAAVQRTLEQQRAVLAQRLTALDREERQIREAAAQRAEAEQARAEAAQIAADLQRAAIEAQIESLREQLELANEWKDILDSTRALVRELTLTSANPLGATARLALFDAEVAQLRQRVAGSSGFEQADAARRLQTSLRERLTLGQEIFQRPGGDYLALFNETLRELAGLESVAEGPASRAEELQEQLNALQQATTDAVNSFAAQSAAFTAEEQARLDAIEEEREAIAEEERQLVEEANAQLASIDAEARAFYQWAQTEGERLAAQRIAELQARLDVITGGRPVDEFIAARLAETTDLLTSIRDDLRAFLARIAGTEPVGGTSPVPIPGTGDGGKPNPGGTVIRAKPAIDDYGGVVVNFHISTGTGSGAREVIDIIKQNAPVIASTLKRELKTA